METPYDTLPPMKDKLAVQEGLLKMGIILIEGNVNEELKTYVLSSLLRLEIIGSPKVTFRFSTSGGNTIPGYAIYDAIRLYPGETEGIVMDKAKSMGCIILQACKVRKAAANAELLIHYGSKNLDRAIIVDDELLEIEKKEAKRDAHIMEDVLMLRANIERTELVNILHEDRIMYTDEAKRIGLIDDII